MLVFDLPEQVCQEAASLGKKIAARVLRPPLPLSAIEKNGLFSSLSWLRASGNVSLNQFLNGAHWPPRRYMRRQMPVLNSWQACVHSKMAKTWVRQSPRSHKQAGQKGSKGFPHPNPCHGRVVTRNVDPGLISPCLSTWGVPLQKR